MQKMRLKRWWLLGLLSFFALIASGGCAFRSIIYSNLEWLVLYQIDDYLDLSSTQKQQLKIPLHETLVWFKAERLPTLIAIFRESQILAKEAKLDGTYLNLQFETFAAWRLEATERLAAPAALLLKNLDDDQIKHLAQRMRKDDLPLEKLLQYSDDEFSEEIKDYTALKAKSLNFWFGKLEKSQVQMMGVELGHGRPFLTQNLQQKQRIREFWLNAMKAQDVKTLIQSIIDGSRADGGWRDLEYQAYRQFSKKSWQVFMQKLLASLEPKQWQHLEKTLAELIDEMEAFSRKK